MYLSNVALREEVNKHAELDPDAREESTVRESICWLVLDKELVISDTIETHYWMF